MQRVWQSAVATVITVVFGSAPAVAQTATYHLHKEASSTTGLFQLKTTGPDAASVAVQSIDLKNQPTGEYQIKEFDTQTGVPNASGYIPSGSTLSFTLWMKKSANFGTVLPRARVKLNNASGTLLCQATGSTGLSTSLTTAFSLSCQTSTAITMTATDRLYLWVGVSVTGAVGNHSETAEVDVEGTSGGNYDSLVVIPQPLTPTISSLNPTSGLVGQTVTITGSNFGATQGTSTVKFNGTTASVTSWSGTSIGTNVPVGASSGPVIVSVNGVASSGTSFTVITPPSISSLNPTSGLVGQAVTITGANFGATQGTSTITFNGTTASVSSWSATSIGATVPVGATTGPVVVTVNGLASGGAAFTVLTPPSLTSLTPTSGSVGQLVTITGTNFGATQGTSTVTFNGTTAQVGSWSASSIGAVVPVGATSGPVVVTVNGLLSNGLTFTVVSTVKYVYDVLGRLVGVIDGTGNAATYTYDAVGNLLAIQRQGAGSVAIVAFAPATAAVGATVIVSGIGFSPVANQNTLTFNGTPATIVASTTTQLTVTVPVGASSGLIAVTTPNGSATSAQAFNVATTASPTITSFSPTTGVPGTAVTITGTNFDALASNDATVLNTTFATVSSATSTTLGVTVPTQTSSGRWQVSTPTGVATSLGDFFVPPAPYMAADVAATGRLAFSTPTVLTVNTANTIGLWLFDGIAGHRISVNLSNPTITRSHVTIYAPDGRVILDTGGPIPGGSATFIGPIALPSTGTYTVLLVPISPYTGSLTFMLYDVLPDITGPIIAGGPPVSFTLTTPGQIARYTFTANAGDRVALQGTNSTIAYSQLAIFRSDGTRVAVANMVTGTGAIDATTLPSTDTYTVLVTPLVDPYTGGMTLTLYSVPADVNITASTDGTPVSVVISAAWQNAYVNFPTNNGDRIVVTLSNSTFGSCNLYGYVFDPSQHSLYGVFCIGSSGTLFLDTKTITGTGTSTIQLDPQGLTTGSVQVAVALVPPDITGPITVNGSTVTVTTTAVGQNAVLTFAGTATQQVTVHLTNNSMGIPIVSLQQPDGSVIKSGSGSGSFNLSQTLPVTGTYSIVVDPQGTNTGSITVGVTNP